MSTKNLARRLILLATLGATLIVPAAAQAQDFQKFTDISYRPQSLIDAIQKSEKSGARPASFGDEYDAGNAVERRLDRIYPRWSWHAFCDQVARRRYSCEITGFGRGLHTADGRATAVPVGYYSRYRVGIRWLQFD